MTHKMYERLLLIGAIVLSPILVPIAVVFIIAINYFPCSYLGKLTEYSQCEEKD